MGSARTGWLIAVVLLGAFAPALASLAREWEATSYQSHGFLVPLVSAWIAWGTRARWQRIPARPDARGWPLLGVGLLAYAAGVLVGSPSLQGVALVATIAGAIASFGGWPRLRALAFPVAYLLFMVPIPPEWMAPLMVQLLVWVSSSATAILAALGDPITRQGNVLILAGGERLFVAEACSGLTSLIALAPVAVLLAYVSPISRRRRLWLVALVVPVAMGANLARVVLTVLATRLWSVETVTGPPWHDVTGLAVYSFACVVMVALARALRQRAPDAARVSGAGAASGDRDATPSRPRSDPPRR
jgi:exosortase